MHTYCVRGPATLAREIQACTPRDAALRVFATDAGAFVDEYLMVERLLDPETLGHVAKARYYRAAMHNTLVALPCDASTYHAARLEALEHVCGLQGFGAIGDICPACEHTRRARDA